MLCGGREKERGYAERNLRGMEELLTLFTVRQLHEGSTGLEKTTGGMCGFVSVYLSLRPRGRGRRERRKRGGLSICICGCVSVLYVSAWTVCMYR